MRGLRPRGAGGVDVVRLISLVFGRRGGGNDGTCCRGYGRRRGSESPYERLCEGGDLLDGLKASVWPSNRPRPAFLILRYGAHDEGGSHGLCRGGRTFFARCMACQPALSMPGIRSYVLAQGEGQGKQFNAGCCCGRRTNESGLTRAVFDDELVDGCRELRVGRRERVSKRCSELRESG